MGLSLAEFDCIYKAYIDNQSAKNREDWERARMIGFSALRPYAKASAKPTDIMQFPWDDKSEKTTNNPPKSTKNRFELISKRWSNEQR